MRGVLELESENYDLEAVFESALNLFAVAARDKGLELVSAIDPSVPSWVCGDAARLRQVLLNLISNAIKFTAKGHVLVEASSRATGTDDIELDISVSDTGIGIPESAAARLFQKFTQADTSITRHYGGTGLGLAICKHLVELMGGKIGIESRVGAGSRFLLYREDDRSDRTVTTIENSPS